MILPSSHVLARRTAAFSLATILATSLVGCGGGGSSDTGAGATATAAVSNTGTAAYDAAANFPGGSCLLWKPHSEIDGGLVLLVPAGMGGATPIIRNANGKVFATGREHVEARGHNQCNGVRYHYIFGKGTGSAFPRPSILSIGGANYKIPNPAGRYE